MDRRLCGELLRSLEKPQASRRAFIGLDGFVDSVIHVVEKRLDANNYQRFETIQAYAQHLLEGAGLSMNIEMLPLENKIGGNGTFFASGLEKYGVPLTYIGAIGKDQIHPQFANFACKPGCRRVGVADPAQTDALEFRDGKIISSKLRPLNELRWEDLLYALPMEEFVREMEQADLFSFNNWTMIPAMSEIWRHILEDVLPRLRAGARGKWAFFDLADPTKRSEKDVLEAMELIRRFRGAGFTTALGLNLREARLIGAILEGGKAVSAEESLEATVRRVSDFLKIDCVVVHPVDRAACVRDGAYFETEGPYCASPKISTGAGDIFNSGFVYGLLREWGSELCLLTGVLSSGFYVRNGLSPDLEELRAFCEGFTR